jgi:hypothetical protein
MAAARTAEGNLMHGALVMASLSSKALHPPDIEMALQPLFVDATRQPSVVAMGT